MKELEVVIVLKRPDGKLSYYYKLDEQERKDEGLTLADLHARMRAKERETGAVCCSYYNVEMGFTYCLSKGYEIVTDNRV